MPAKLSFCYYVYRELGVVKNVFQTKKPTAIIYVCARALRPTAATGSDKVLTSRGYTCSSFAADEFYGGNFLVNIRPRVLYDLLFDVVLYVKKIILFVFSFSRSMERIN